MEEELAGKNYLVTTPIQETWPTNGKIIFLGEWCKIYSRRDDWNHINYKVLPYHWDDRKKLFNDYEYLTNLYESILVSLSQTLNNIHGVNFSNKYWRILIGPWLGIFIQVIYDRWEMIQKASNLEEQLYSIITQNDINKHVPNDMSDFLSFISSDEWNQYIFESIIEENNIIKPIRSLIDYKRRDINLKINRKKKYPIHYIKFITKTFINFLAKIIVRSNSPLVISSYLSRKNELNMSIKNRYFPFLTNLKKPSSYTFSNLERNFKVKFKTNDPFEKFMLKSINKQIPKAYVEGYESLTKEVDDLGWPKRPKYIFTSNADIADDLFKCYIAYQTSKRVPLFIGQHGGFYGTGKFFFIEDHQISISDKFISWGWTNNKYDNKIIPIGNLKVINSKVKNSFKKTTLLLITCTMPRYSYHLYSIFFSSQWINYFDDQCRFIDSLDKKIRPQATVRLYETDYGWNQLIRWKMKFPNLKYDLNKQPLIRQLKKAKLVVSTYNATTFLESMSMNIPTVIFWNPYHSELRDDAIPFYEELEKAKIFHKNPTSASNHINMVWEGVDIWWNSDKVQRIKEKFLNRYCRNEDNLVYKLTKEFKAFPD